METLIADGIDRMPKLERTVLSLYYQEELNLREIAEILNVHTSRVSQLKAQAVLRLRAYLEKRLTPAMENGG
jgi:RNA polymerase sigma factor for flagellar operon FliA